MSSQPSVKIKTRSPFSVMLLNDTNNDLQAKLQQQKQEQNDAENCINKSTDSLYSDKHSDCFVYTGINCHGQKTVIQAWKPFTKTPTGEFFKNV